MKKANSGSKVSKARKADIQPIKSAMRTLALLEYFRRTKASASVTEISAALGYPQSSTSVLLKSLVSLNYLEHDAETRRFLPSYRVALLGDWIQRARFGDQRITDVMEFLHRDTGETIMLGQQIGVGLQYLHVILPANHRIQFTVHIGEIRPMSRTGLGQMLLSRKTNSQVRAIARRNNADERHVPSHFRETALIQEMEAIRQRGYSETRGRTTPGANTIGMLVQSSGKSLLAIGIGGPIDRMDSKRQYIIDTLRRRLGMTS